MEIIATALFWLVLALAVGSLLFFFGRPLLRQCAKEQEEEKETRLLREKALEELRREGCLTLDEDRHGIDVKN